MMDKAKDTLGLSTRIPHHLHPRSRLLTYPGTNRQIGTSPRDTPDGLDWNSRRMQSSIAMRI